MPALGVRKEGPAVFFSSGCEFAFHRIVPNIDNTVSPYLTAFFRGTAIGALKPSGFHVAYFVVQPGESTVYLPYASGEVADRPCRDGHVGMVRHGTRRQNIDSVPGSHRAKDCEPDQIIALTVEEKAMIGRSLIAVVQDTTFEESCLHRITNMHSCKLRSCDNPEAFAKMRNSIESYKFPPMPVSLPVVWN